MIIIHKINDLLFSLFPKAGEQGRNTEALKEALIAYYTELMKSFHGSGTFWTQIDNIIETPLFVNSQLTSMVQIADVCAFSFRDSQVFVACPDLFTISSGQS